MVESVALGLLGLERDAISISTDDFRLFDQISSAKRELV